MLEHRSVIEIDYRNDDDHDQRQQAVIVVRYLLNKEFNAVYRIRLHKVDAENVPIIFFNMEPMAETMEAYDSIWYVGAQAKESGVMCAQALINYWNENKGIADKNGDNILQLVILQGEIGQQDVILRTEAYEETLTEQGIDYEIIAIDTANWDKAQALDKMNAWITAFGIDGVEGVLANNDSMAMGAVQAALNNGYNKGDPNKVYSHRRNRRDNRSASSDESRIITWNRSKRSYKPIHSSCKYLKSNRKWRNHY